MKQENKEVYEALLKEKETLDIQIYEALESIILGDELKSKCFSNDGKFICHHCGGTHTCKAGINKQGKQKYKCHDCVKEMIMQRNVITFSTKKKFSQWIIFLKSELDGNSLEVSAEKAGISKRTSFRWRHKVMYILNTFLNKQCLEGIVYLDETLYPVVNKSSKSEKVAIPKKRGMSEQKINVTCAIDAKGNTIIKVLSSGRVTSNELIGAYENLISKEAKVVSDSLRSYHKLMKKLEVTWIKIPSKKKSMNEYNLDPINDLHSSIKDFTYKYKGISIKYLQGYMALFDFQRRHKKHYDNIVLFRIIRTIFTGFSDLRCEFIDSDSPLYL